MRWLLVCLLCVTSGCVSIFRSSDAEIMVETEPAGALASYRGQSVRTPGFLRLPRDHPGQIRIVKPGYDNTFINFDARPDAGFWTLSILSNASHGYFTLGVSFVFGMIVDIGSGALNSFDGGIAVRLEPSPQPDPPLPAEQQRPEVAPAAATLPPESPARPDRDAASDASAPEEGEEGVKILTASPSLSSDGPPGPAPERVPLTRPERLAYDSYRAALEAGALGAEDREALGRVLSALRHAEAQGGDEHADAVLSEFAAWVLAHPQARQPEVEQRWQVVLDFYR